MEKVEFWNPWSKTRHDLFGILDLLCIYKGLFTAIHGRTLGVQVTTLGQRKPHLKKMKESKNLELLKKAGWGIELHSWRKLKKTGWTNKVETL